MLGDGRAAVQAQRRPNRSRLRLRRSPLPIPAPERSASTRSSPTNTARRSLNSSRKTSTFSRTASSRRSIGSSGGRIRHLRSARSLRQAKSRTMRTNAARPRSLVRASLRSISTIPRQRGTEHRTRPRRGVALHRRANPSRGSPRRLKPLDHLTEIRFTRDRDAARQSVSSFTGRRNDYTPRNTFEEQYPGSRLLRRVPRGRRS